jgi:hypothetical protein
MPATKTKKPLPSVRILHLNLVAGPFDKIAAGTKREEYRDFSPYWKARLAGREYDVIEFRNGYAPDSRRMRVEFRGVTVKGRGAERQFVIQLGRIVVRPTRRVLSAARVTPERDATRSRRADPRASSEGRAMRTKRPTIRTPQDLRRVIEGLSPKSPITDRFSAQWREGGRRGGGQQEQGKVWYRTQHEHWLGWLEGYLGPGAYNRKDHRRTAEFVYNHIVNPQMLIYLAEASRLPRPLVQRAARAALAHATTMSAMCGAIRREISWKMIEAALLEED